MLRIVCLLIVANLAWCHPSGGYCSDPKSSLIVLIDISDDHIWLRSHQTATTTFGFQVLGWTSSSVSLQNTCCESSIAQFKCDPYISIGYSTSGTTLTIQIPGAPAFSMQPCAVSISACETTKVFPYTLAFVIGLGVLVVFLIIYVVYRNRKRQAALLHNQQTYRQLQDDQTH